MMMVNEHVMTSEEDMSFSSSMEEKMETEMGEEWEAFLLQLEELLEWSEQFSEEVPARFLQDSRQREILVRLVRVLLP